MDIIDYIKEYYTKKTDYEMVLYINSKCGTSYTAKNIGALRMQHGLYRTSPNQNNLVISRIKIYGRVFRIGSINITEGVMCIMMRGPFLVARGSNTRTATKRLRESIKKELEMSSKKSELTWEIVNKIRRFYLEGWSHIKLENKFKCTVWKILNNDTWYDKNYVPPRRKFKNQGEPVSINELGETKTLYEWSRDPRCKAPYSLLRKRYSKGIRGTALLEQGDCVRRGPKGIVVEIFGEKKSLREWARDKRCKVTKSTIHYRYDKGIRGAKLLKEKEKKRQR